MIGRPTKHRSRLAVSVTAAVVELTAAQREAVLRVCLLHSGEAARALSNDPDMLPEDLGDAYTGKLAQMPPDIFMHHFGQLGDFSQTLAAVELAHARYRSAHAALGEPGAALPEHIKRKGANKGAKVDDGPASPADEAADLVAIAALARSVLDLIERRVIETSSIAPAADLGERLERFPPLAASQLTHEPKRAVQFEEARLRLIASVGDVRWWPDYADSHCRDLRLLIDVCEGIGKPTFPKWSRVLARDRLADALRMLYRPEWHAARMEGWRDEAGELEPGEAPIAPPLPAPAAFADDLLQALEIPREQRKRK